MNVTVQVNDIGLETRFNIEQPVSGPDDVLPRIMHPFQPVSAFEEFDPRDCG
jgi:hypothetical protein